MGKIEHEYENLNKIFIFMKLNGVFSFRATEPMPLIPSIATGLSPSLRSLPTAPATPEMADRIDRIIES